MKTSIRLSVFSAVAICLLSFFLVPRAEGGKNKSLDALAAAVKASVDADPTMADFYLTEVENHLEYKFVALSSQFKRSQIAKELSYLAIAEIIRRKYPDLARIWKMEFADLDRSIQKQLDLPVSPDNKAKHAELSKESLKILKHTMSEIAKDRKLEGARPGETKEAGVFDIRVLAVPTGARRYYTTVFRNSLFTKLDESSSIWTEILSEQTKLHPGNYLFEARWPNGVSKKYGPSKIVRNETITLD